MSQAGDDFHAAMPHDAAEPEPRRRLPDRSMLVRGIGLAALAMAGFAAAVTAGQRAGWLAAPVVALFAGAGGLAAWAAAVHLTGGEKFDDHPWI